MVKPSDTPRTTLLARLRAVPHCMRARRLSVRGLKTSLSPSLATDDVVMHHELQLAPLALGLEMLALEVDGDPGGDGNRILADARHGQNTLQMTSPPTLAARASASDMTPRGVDRIEMPSPLKWRGSSRIFE